MYIGIRKKKGTDETLQNFINKHIVDLENVRRNKKKEKGEFSGCQVSSNYMSNKIFRWLVGVGHISPCQKLIACNRLVVLMGGVS
jgi:hypothetical protein